MRIIYPFLALCCLFLVSFTTTSAERTFFPFDNAFPKGTPVEEQVALLKELGYDGICSRPGNATPELFAALDKHGLKMNASYVVMAAKAGAPIPAWIRAHIEQLKGRDTIVWLSLTVKEATDEAAVDVIRRVYDLCAANEVEMVLYGHDNFKTDTAEGCARLRALSKRPGIGLSFTLCHELRQKGDEGIEDTLRSIAPHLKLVQINGANTPLVGTKGWGDYIKPLGHGSFDIGRIFRTLDEIDYDGPVNLQCYKVDQPAREHLGASMQVWKQFN